MIYGTPKLPAGGICRLGASTMNLRKLTNIALIASIGYAAAGCETKAETGALVGAGSGAALGAMIGAGVGAIGGALVGNEMDKQDRQREREHEREYADYRRTDGYSDSVTKR